MSTTTKAADMTAELMAATGAAKPTYVAGRLLKAGLLAECSRCGGSGSYSYCAAYGTTCFKCNGLGKAMPRVTKKLVAAAAAFWTPERQAEHVAELREKIAAKARVNDAGRAVYRTKTYLELERLTTEALGEKAGWMARWDWQKVNTPALLAARDAQQVVQKKIDKVVQPIFNGKRYDKAAKAYVPVEWAAVEAELAPLYAEMAALEVVA